MKLYDEGDSLIDNDILELQKIIIKSKRIRTILYCIILILACTTLVFLGLFLWQFLTNNSKEYNPFTHLTGFCKDVEDIPPQEFEERRRLLSQKIRESNFDAAVMEWSPSMYYFTKIQWKHSERPLLFIVDSNEHYAIIAPKFEEPTIKERINFTLTDFLTWQEDEDPYILVEHFLSKHLNKTNDFRIALEPEMRQFVLRGLENHPNLKLFFGHDIFTSIRIVKSVNEEAILDCANRATKAVLKKIAESELKEGMTEDDAKALIRQGLLTAGLSNPWHIALFGPNAAYPHGTQNKLTLKKGMLVLMDIGGSLYGYNSDITRTIKFGEIDEKMENAWNVVKQAQKAAIDFIKPGVSCGEVDAVARKVMNESGYAGDYTFFTHRLGHGIGLQGHEYPYLVKDNTQKLEEGMTFSVEPGIYVLNEFGVRFEDIVIVTKDGAKVFGELDGE